VAFSYQHGHVRISARRPLGFRCCDRCGFNYSRDDLTWQYEWNGSSLTNLRLLVCETCRDRPNPQLRTYVPGADPIPFFNPRVDLDLGWPMETNPIYDTRGVIIRDTAGVVLTSSGGTVGKPATPYY
jgi:hypothetical protein